MLSLKATEVAVCVVNLFAGSALSLGIVWYIGKHLPESKRTLANCLISLQVLMIICFDIRVM